MSKVKAVVLAAEDRVVEDMGVRFGECLCPEPREAGVGVRRRAAEPVCVCVCVRGGSGAGARTRTHVGGWKGRWGWSGKMTR